MSASVFDSKRVMPNDKMLTVELGKSKEFLDKTCLFIKEEYKDLRLEWKFYGQKSGWILKLFNNKRNVLFIVPCVEHFRTVFTFGDKAVDEVIANGLISEFIKQQLITAPKYREGRTIQLEVKSKADYENIIELIKIKLNN